MGRTAPWLIGALLVAGLTGCVERRMLIVSDPPGATVFVNGENLGTTPASVPFTYYGKYDVTLVRDGYQTQTYKARLPRPWFEFFPIDFFAENVWPFHVQDNHLLRFAMEPLIQPRTEDVLSDARAVRQRGLLIGAPPSEN